MSEYQLSQAGDEAYEREMQAEGPRENAPLTHEEYDAIEGWIPKSARMITHVRGRSTRTDRPLWVVTSEGVLVASLTEERAGQLRARVNWVPTSQLRRVDLIANDRVALLRVVTATRRFVLFGGEEPGVTRFAIFARALSPDHPVWSP